MRKHYFISGLPRAGSTLLCNILAQNPLFYVSPATSGCHDVLFGIRNQWDRLVEHQAEGVNYAQLNRVMSSALDAYHNTDKSVVFDKGRGWLSLMEMLEFIKADEPKIIVPVRDLAEILASFEMLWRRSTGKTQWAFEASDYFKAQTVEGRCDIWSGQGQPVGLAYNRVKDAMGRGKTENMFFLEFEDLTNNPKESMDRMYDFLGEKRFSHNFDHVEQVTSEDDVNVHRIPGLHSIRTKVEPVPRKAEEVLGPQLASRYYNLELWRPARAGGQQVPASGLVAS
jgi:sulfotransferase